MGKNFLAVRKKWEFPTIEKCPTLMLKKNMQEQYVFKFPLEQGQELSWLLVKPSFHKIIGTKNNDGKFELV